MGIVGKRRARDIRRHETVGIHRTRSRARHRLLPEERGIFSVSTVEENLLLRRS